MTNALRRRDSSRVVVEPAGFPARAGGKTPRHPQNSLLDYPILTDLIDEDPVEYKFKPLVTSTRR